MKPKLYQYEACPFCNKVRTMLKYKGVEFESIEVHPLKKKEIAFSPDYQAVPIYIDSQGKQINDSTPIMRWIDKEFPERRAFRSESEDAEKEEKWLAWSERLVKGLPVVIYDTFFNALKSFDYITKVGKFSWIEKRTIKFSGAFVMTLVAKKIRKREQIERPDLFLKQKTAEWAAGLGGSPFMGGLSPNGADLAVFGVLQSLKGLPAALQLQENPGFAAWLNRMKDGVDSAKPAAVATPV